MAKTQSKTIKQAYYWILLLIVFVGVVLVNVISSYANKKFDFTDDQRHSLTPSTIEFLEKTDSAFSGRVYIEVFLDGNLPAELSKFRGMVEDRLKEFSDIAGDRIEYKFVNPKEGDEAAVIERERQLWDNGSGVLPMNVLYSEDGKESQLRLWPGAKMSYAGGTGTKELIIQLLPGTRTDQPYYLRDLPQLIQGGMRNLEYNLMNGLRRVTRVKVPKIGFLQGHGELNFGATFRARSVIGADYNVQNVSIDGQINALDDLDGLVIARPTQRMSNEDLYLIDQFVLRGGRLMCFVDALEMREDSLRVNRQTHTVRIETGLNRMLFDYGISIKDNYVLDVNCGVKPSPLEKNARIPWFYHVLATPTEHPVSKNLEPVSLKYVSQLDYGKKSTSFAVTPILTSSSNVTVTGSAPLVTYAIPLNFLDKTDPKKAPKLSINPDDPNNKKILAAVSEGKFDSAFKTRLPPEFKNQKDLKHKDASTLEGKVFVVANSRMITNTYDSLLNPTGTEYMYRPKQGPNELLQDRELAAMRIPHLFGNQDFFMNLVDFMMGDNSVLDIRSKQIEIHAMDKEEVLENASFYKLINILVPILLIIALAFIMFLIRRKKYA